jgi:hypothetical protein
MAGILQDYFTKCNTDVPPILHLSKLNDPIKHGVIKTKFGVLQISSFSITVGKMPKTYFLF